MFTNDFLRDDVSTRLFLTEEEAETLYARRDDIPTLTEGLAVATADVRYAPITGSTVYATKSELPDVSGKANVTEVVAALQTKSDTNHTHSGVYQPVGSYLVAADIAGKANTSDVTSALAGKADVAHTHAQYAPATGSTVYATKDEVTEATGGGLTQTAADGRYVQQTALYQEVTDITDQLYHTKDATYTKTQVDTALSQKSDTTHTHAGVYQPVGSYLVAADIAGKANTTDVTTALAGKADSASVYTKTESDAKYLTTDDDSAYQTKANMVVLGTETTYYSKAKVDALLAALSGGTSPVTHLSAKWYNASGMNIPANTKYLIPFDIQNDPNGYGLYGNTNQVIQYNNTPLTLSGGFWVNSGTDTVVVTASWTLQTYGDYSFYKATWLRYYPTTGDVPTDLSRNIGADVVDTGAGLGSVETHLGSTTSVRLVPNAKFGIYVLFTTNKALVDSVYNQGVTLNVVCSKM